LTLERKLAFAMSMDDATWLRQANPWSVWTRASVLPLVILAVWSRDWLGSWSWVAIALSVLWMWLNPRIFRRAESWTVGLREDVIAQNERYRSWLD
jgi:hypothetical protein